MYAQLSQKILLVYTSNHTKMMVGQSLKLILKVFVNLKFQIHTVVTKGHCFKIEQNTMGNKYTHFCLKLWLTERSQIQQANTQEEMVNSNVLEGFA